MAEKSTWTVATRFEERRLYPTTSDAEAYAERLCTAVYGEEAETKHQRPFHAADEGDTWRVTGSRPDWFQKPTFPITGPFIVVFEKATGRVLDVHFGMTPPPGWEAEMARKADLARKADAARAPGQADGDDGGNPVEGQAPH